LVIEKVKACNVAGSLELSGGIFKVATHIAFIQQKGVLFNIADAKLI
jgi:hypothetical protein